MDAFQITTTITLSCLWSILIHPPYPHNLHFLLLPLMLVPHTSFSSTPLWVALEILVILVKKKMVILMDDPSIKEDNL